MQPRRNRTFPVLAGVFLCHPWLLPAAHAQTTWQQYTTNSSCPSNYPVPEIQALYSGIEVIGSVGQEEALASDPAILQEVKNDNWFMTGHKGHNAVLREVNFNTSHIYATYNTTYDGSQISAQTIFSHRCKEATCEAGTLAWHGEVIPPGEAAFSNWQPESLVSGQCVYEPVIGGDCGDTTAEEINAMPEGNVSGHMWDGSYVINMAYCSTGNSDNSGSLSPIAPQPTPDHPSPYTETETSSASDNTSAPVQETLADGSAVTTTTKTEVSNGGGTVSFVDSDGYDPTGGPIATYGNSQKGSETTQTVTEVREYPDGTVTTTVTTTVTKVNPFDEFRDLNIPANDDDDYTSFGGGSDTTTTTTTTTENPDGSTETDTTTDGDGECVGDSCTDGSDDACPHGVDCTFDSSDADALYNQLKDAVEGTGPGAEVGAAVGTGDLPPTGVDSLPGYSACQSLTTTWAGYSLTFPGVEGCAKVETLKTFFNWAGWIILLLMLYSLVVRKPG